MYQLQNVRANEALDTTVRKRNDKILSENSYGLPILAAFQKKPRNLQIDM
jgi:hypothetical protein